ncbi:hypothetical protein NLI96_g3357 [Meripilus lineatus]|uniref:Glucose-methanol-choline oxidoreductase N-terminal domain-containing protein n=1 Tax=Meripilus lineatus TaxID=2056292 RepID=A0AAD5YFQ4_9APHY|nr:hypothetical protein NLI96_g3357 [Physisporinus lineatus]
MAATSQEASSFSSTSFDYLIIGGGTGGLTVAARLAENPKITVGVLEAGPYLPDMTTIKVPGYCWQNVGNPDVDWMFKSVPQKNLHGRQLALTRGKILGGTSALNFTLMSRAAASEYDALESLGNDGWNWNEILRYSRKSETLASIPSEDAQKYNITPEEGSYGTNGPIARSFPVAYSELDLPFLETLEELGVKTVSDPQTGNIVGSWMASFSIDRKTVSRSYAITGYYQPNMHRPNFHVLTSAHVTKILTRRDADGVVATGVQFKHNNVIYAASAKQEVILSAGAFQTPQILELSGIGNPSILKEHGLETVIDLPGVGENLHPAVAKHHTELYFNEQKGLFTSPFSAVAILPLQGFSSHSATEKIAQSVKGLNADSPVEKLFKQWIDDPNHGQMELALSLRLRPNVGVHLDDADMLVEAVKFIRKLTLTLPLEQFHQEFVEPGPKIQTDKETTRNGLSNLDLLASFGYSEYAP